VEGLLRIGAFLGVFVVMGTWEAARPRRRLTDPRRLRWPANLGLVVLGAVAGGAAVAAAAFAAEQGVGLFHWFDAPVWVAWLATLVVLDFAVYLQHVLFHAVPILWRLHRVHHADLGFDASTGLRFHPIEILLSIGLKAAIVVLLGSPPWAVVAFEIVLNAASLFNHGNVAIPEALDRRLRWLVVTPDMHRIHHSSRVAETNSNFGFSVSWWDRLCGTYRADPALGQLGLEIGLVEYRRSLGLGQLLALPFIGAAGAYTFAGDRPAEEGNR
jgi:sterol desaturase/sphingolipid hydroxylase (fatty acid hydroxylase superfamily)